MNSKALRLFFIAILFPVMNGCATTYTPPPNPPLQAPGIYHEVKRGETLWRIAKTYDISVDELMRANRLADSAQISAGQRLFIPDAAGIRAVPKLEDIQGTPRDFLWPARGRVIAFFGAIKENAVNKGIDIRMKEGEEVVASRSGRVVFADDKLKGFGKTLIIDHGDNYSTVYAHNSQLLVKAGDEVRRGQAVAKAGSTGRAKEPFLHYEIRKGHEPQNPLYYLP